MFSSEIRETVYIGIALMLVAIVLGVVAVVIDIRGDFATIKNEQSASYLQVKEYRTYNAYDDKLIYPEEVIELILSFQDTGLDIYIDAYGDNYLINKDTINSDPNYKNHAHLKNIVFADNIRNVDMYWVGVVYDNQDMTTIRDKSDILKEYYSDITGIIILESN